MVATPGKSLGPYEIVGSIGAGGMGEVYRARDPRLGRDVAVKVLPVQFASDAERLRRFEQEARAVAALNDPNILAIYDIGTQPGGSPYIVTELLEGETLRDRLRSGPLPLRKATELAGQVARGLAAAHDKHIVHRDLKPENIYLTRDGRAKILDFGLAKLTEPQVREAQSFGPTEGGTNPGMVLGTVGYMSPEQVRGQESDYRCDIFSFGAILYEMLSGKRAFRGETNADTMSAILREDPPELTETNRAIPPALERIVRHCLEKEPEQRFQSARDVAFGLEALSGSSSSAMGLPGAVAARASHAGRRAKFAAVGLIGLFAASALAYWVGASSNANRFPEYKPITFRRGSLYNARFGPDGKTIFYAAAWEGAPQEIYTGRTDSLGERPTGLTQANLLAVSSAGEMAIRSQLVIMPGFARRGLLSIVPTGGGAPRPTLENVQDVDWSADGKEMAIVRFDPQKELWRLEFPVGKVLLEGSNWVNSPRVSPDGQHVAFFDNGNAVGDDRGDVAVLDLNGKKTTLSTGWSSLVGLAWSPKGNELWFGASKSGTLHNLFAVNLKGTLRHLATMPADVSIQDVFRDGRILVKKQQIHFEIYGGAEGQASEKKLDWLDWSIAAALSDDGKYLLFEEEGEGGGPDYTVYLRPTDGSPAVALGHGNAIAISSDSQWALTATIKAPSQYILQPTGAGEARTLTHDSIDHGVGVFLPDNKRILFAGRESGHAARLYLLDIESGATKPLTPEGALGKVVSPDGHFVVVRQNNAFFKWPIDGGDPVPIAGLEKQDFPLQWSADGRQLYLARTDESHPRRVYLFDLATQKRTLWKSLAPTDWTGAGDPGMPGISRDGKHYVYAVGRALGDLYVVSGLK